MISTTIFPSDYCGHILHRPYREELQNRIRHYSVAFQAYEDTGVPALPYIAAWQDGDKTIWYEFVSHRFSALMECPPAQLAEVFRQRVIDRRIYKHEYLGFGTSIKQEIIPRLELSNTRSVLREEVKRAGSVEAVYQVSAGSNGVIWLKDQARLEIYERDKICLSLGCLTPVTKEMEAEAELKRIEEELRAANQRIEIANRQLSEEILERKRVEESLQEANRMLQHLATRDGLTQIANRHCFEEWLDREWLRARREHKPLALIMCDVDYFKLYNDTYGHRAGDLCLCAVAQAIAGNARRPVDLAARYGGEEFIVVLPDTESHQAVHVAELIQRSVRSLKIAHPYSPVGPYVSVSQGLCSVIPDAECFPDDLIQNADAALYQAKAQGRDRIVVKPFDIAMSYSRSGPAKDD